MTLSADGQRLFVASGSTSSVWVFDTFSREAIEQISMNLFPQAPPTSTPNSLGLSPDGKTLLVSNADNNNVAVVDVSNPARSLVRGFIPTGSYPTGAIFSIPCLRLPPRRAVGIRGQLERGDLRAGRMKHQHGKTGRALLLPPRADESAGRAAHHVWSWFT